ncbi:MAG: nitrile hydratase subunit beta [Chloroflexota bacterium]|nr:nitrile hydratase subunit beta [Chloroflexota bacterium]
MNGAHDLGGMHGFGPVEIEPYEPVFHHDWERRAFALTLAAGFLGRWNIDQGRFAREQMAPAEYLATSYYEHWLFGLQKLLNDLNLVTDAERAERQKDPASPALPVADARPLAAHNVDAALRNSRAAKVDEEVTPRYSVDDQVVARNINPIGHTRLPRYARGKGGVVTIDHGVWVFPDSAANGRGRNPQHCYSVRFEARELWGDEAPWSDAVYIDLWDDHLEPA